MAMRQRGFSLVELMVTIAILMLLILAAMPGIGTWLENTRIRNQADSIMAGLQTARAEAVRTNQNVSFWLVSSTAAGALDDGCALSDTSASWVVSVTAPAGHCAGWLTTTPAKIVVSRAMGGDMAHVSVSALQSDATTPGTTVTFNGFGRIANADPIAEVDLDGTGGGTYRQLSVRVSPSGSVRMCDPLVTSSTDPRKCPTP
jgi:type IV fimbrial biogenesis protein FimT